MGLPSPRWCWTLRHQDEETSESQRVRATAVEAGNLPYESGSCVLCGEEGVGRRPMVVAGVSV